MSYPAVDDHNLSYKDADMKNIRSVLTKVWLYIWWLLALEANVCLL